MDEYCVKQYSSILDTLNINIDTFKPQYYNKFAYKLKEKDNESKNWSENKNDRQYDTKKDISTDEQRGIF